MTDPRPATVEQVCAATGLGKRQVLRLVRERRIPGQIVGRQLVMTAGQFDALIRDGIAPAPATRPENPLAPSFIQRRKAS